MRIADFLLDDDGRIDAERWVTAIAESTMVALCSCGGAALPDAAPVEIGRWTRPFYMLACSRCGADTVVPAAKVVRAPRPADTSYMQAAREREAAMLGERD